MSLDVDYVAVKKLLGTDSERIVEETKQIIDTGLFAANSNAAVNADGATFTVTMGTRPGSASVAFQGSGYFASSDRPNLDASSPFKMKISGTVATLFNSDGTQIWTGIGSQNGLSGKIIPDITFPIT